MSIQENRLLVGEPQIRANSYSSQSPDSHRFSTKSDSSLVGDNDEIEDEEETCGNNNNNNKRNDVISRSLVGVTHSVVVDSKMSSSKSDQDTISDESGYSEESNAVSTINCPFSSSTSPTVSIKVIDKNIAKDDSNGANIIKVSNTLTSNVPVEKISIRGTNEDSARASYGRGCNGRERKEECVDEYHLNSDMPVQEDSTVHGVLISEFSTTERLKYLERSRQMSDSKLSSATAPPDFLQNKIQEFVINI